jgi:tRNA dimethylallyltransferase
MGRWETPYMDHPCQLSAPSTFRHETVDSSGGKVLVLVGPTASGKTAIGVHLAKRLHGEVISADSRQVFKYLDVGTAKPTRAQRASVPHHFVDELLPDEEFNAGQFGDRGRVVIRKLFDKGLTPIVVGGSGLYVRSLIDGLFEGPGADKEYREILEARVRAGGVQKLIEELRTIDPGAAAKADPSKPRRIIRALEVYHVTGRPISAHHQEQHVLTEFRPVMFGLEWDRKTLYDRINRRCEEMIAAGLLQEVERLEKRGYDTSINALNTVGYAEAFAYRRGEISYDEMVRLFRQNSRRYAKRQLTWFRRDSRIQWIRINLLSTSEEVAEEISRRFVVS